MSSSAPHCQGISMIICKADRICGGKYAPWPCPSEAWHGLLLSCGSKPFSVHASCGVLCTMRRWIRQRTSSSWISPSQGLYMTHLNGVLFSSGTQNSANWRGHRIPGRHGHYKEQRSRYFGPSTFGGVLSSRAIFDLEPEAVSNDSLKSQIGEQHREREGRKDAHG